MDHDISSEPVVPPAPEISLLKIADEVAFWEKSILFPGRGDVILGAAISRHPAAALFRPVKVTTTVRNFRLRDVVLDANTMLLLKNSAKTPETSYFLSGDAYVAAHVRHDALIRLDDRCDYIVAHNRVHGAYQHWLTQCLPAIDWSLRGRQTEDAQLLLPTLTEWQEDTLDLLGYSGVPRLAVKSNAQYQLPRAEYSEFLNGRTSFGICLSGLDTCRRMLRSITPRRAEPVVYVRNARPYYGTIINEERIVSFFASRGVYILEKGTLSTAARINLFHQADAIIGPHGEGLSDVVFCKPGTLLWEFMPPFMRNASFNRLAQAGELDYWGDHFDAVEQDGSRHWEVDLDILAQRMNGISQRLASRFGRPEPYRSYKSVTLLSGTSRRRKPLDELMLEFESLGDNCEFGMVQRHVGVEPLGLLRFGGINLPAEVRLEKLIAALEAEFVNLGSPDTVSVGLAGEGHREFLVTESIYNLMYHTFMSEDQIESEVLRRRETVRLRLLRRKLLHDLKNGEKITVWKSNTNIALHQIEQLLAVLRRQGPNILLWVVEADDVHPAGSVERIADDLLKGYVERFAPYSNATDISPQSWLEVCQAVYDICRPDHEEC